MCIRDRDLKAAQELFTGTVTGLDVVKALAKNKFADVAENVLGMLKQRISCLLYTS